MNRIDIETIVPISKNLHVLYVEDNQQAREQTVKLLENFFDHITVAVDGLEMLEKIRRCDIDVTSSSSPRTMRRDTLQNRSN